MAAETPAAPLDRAAGRARTAIDALDAESQTACLRDWKSETLNECAMALRSLLAALDADKRLEEAGAIITQLSREWARVDTAARCAALAWLARREGEKGKVPE